MGAERRESPHPVRRPADDLSCTPSKIAVRPPEFGEQTEAALEEFGFGKDEIAELRQRKVV